ncbi:hypothetical protein DFQ26_006461 [Actinomortierella ambigua]|nr:hypothetical protein DFQ26_006461 [Actinomortierella ambigua]
MIRYSSNDVKGPVQSGSVKGREQVGHGQQPTSPSVPLVTQLTRGQREALRVALADVYIDGRVEKAKEKAQLGSYYEFAKGIAVWGDFAQVWARWLSSIGQDALAAIPHFTPQTKISPKIRKAISRSSSPLVGPATSSNIVIANTASPTTEAASPAPETHPSKTLGEL